MRLILQVRSANWSGKEIVVEEHQSIRVGRTALADVSFPDDFHMSGIHFRVECGADPMTCFIEDMHSSNGTFLNGARAGRARIRHGDTIVAGKATFFVRTEKGMAQVTSPPMAEVAAGGGDPQERLLRMLCEECQPLYAVLDAAAEPSVLKALVESKEEYQSLYEGPEGAQLVHFAPYLVRLPQDSSLLRTLIEQGWGKNWGVYLTCDKPLQEVRRHLRNFLMVRIPGGTQVYFRFYDPRVLRSYLPTCTQQEVVEFLGPIGQYLLEDEKAEKLLSFGHTGDRKRRYSD